MNARAGLLALLIFMAGPGLDSQSLPSLAELQARARADSNDPVAHYALAQGFLQAKQVDSARHSLETAILIDREFTPAYVLLGSIEVAQLPPGSFALLRANGQIRFVRLPRPGVQDTTALLFRRAFLLDPLQGIYAANGLHMPYEWAGTLEHAMREYRRNRLEEAAALFDTVIVKSDQRHKPPPPDSRSRHRPIRRSTFVLPAFWPPVWPRYAGAPTPTTSWWSAPVRTWRRRSAISPDCGCFWQHPDH